MRLVPYLSALLRGAETRGTPTLRPLPLAFPDDTGAIAFADDEYMLGPDLLVAPITRAGATGRQVHLPPGTWIALEVDGSSAETFAGPRDVAVVAPLGHPIVFARSGALIPTLRDGIDTLAETTDPMTVSAASVVGSWEAWGWLQGDARATYDDGSALEIADRADGAHVRFVPAGGAKDVTITLDVRRRAVANASRVAGGDVVTLKTEADVRASTGNAVAFGQGRVVLKLVGASELLLR
jgi:hypothetical protein